MGLRTTIRAGVEHGLAVLPRRTQPGDRLILAYHNIVPEDWASHGDASLHLSAERFYSQLRMLRRESDVVPLMELLESTDRSSRLTAITFDDAYFGAVTQGVDLCLQEGIGCAVFVAPMLLGCLPTWDRLADLGRWSDSERDAFLWTERGLAEPDRVRTDADPCRIATEDELAAVAFRSGVTLGNHTMRHANLGALTFDEACDELSQASMWLKTRFGESYIPVSAYPYGIPPADAESVLSTQDLHFGLLVKGGWHATSQSSQSGHIPRWNVPAGISDRGFLIRVRGRLTNG